MPRAPEIRQNILDFLTTRSYNGVVDEPIMGLWHLWRLKNPGRTTSDRSFRQAINKMREDGYLSYDSSDHKIGPIRINERVIRRNCAIYGEHRYICACGQRAP